jgi:hypothetical protein
MTRRGPDDDTPFGICTTARSALRWVPSGAPDSDHPKVRVSMLNGPIIMGRLKSVSAVNAWIKVDGQKVPTDYVRRVDYV